MNIFFLSELIRDSLRNLVRHKIRSTLTLLGVVFGIASVITMLAVGEGAQRTVLQEIKAPLGDHLREELSRGKDLFGSLEQVMEAVAVQEKVIVVVDKPVSNPKELIKTLPCRPVVSVGPKVPLAK